MRRGTVIIFRGIDGSGKTTAAKSLAKHLRVHGYRIKHGWNRSLHTFAYVTSSLFRLFRNERLISNSNKVMIQQFKPSDLGL
jgi:tRNA uridine 5-carbamoylmethylation protein Kti12